MMLSASLLQAQIASWDFSGLTGGLNDFGPSPFAPSSADANVMVGGLTRGSGVTQSGTGAGNAWGGTGFDGPTSLNAAITANNFATFSVSANAGYALSLSDIAAYNIRRSSSGPTTGQWQYSIDNGSFVNIGSAITWGGTTSASGNAQAAIDLSGISALQDIPAGSVVTFRVVSWTASSSSGSWYLNDPEDDAADDFVLNGSVFTCTNPPVPAAPITAVGCESIDLNIDGNPTLGSGTYTAHLWTDLGTGTATGVTLINETDQVVTLNVASSGTVNLRYKVTDDNGCTGTKDVVVTINAAPSGALTATENSGLADNDNQICAGASITFTATSGFDNYAFSVNGNLQQSGVSNTYTTTAINDGDDIEVIATDNAGCQAVIGALNITVHALPAPSITAQTNVSCNGLSDGSVTISGGTLYSLDGGPFQASGTFSGLAAGAYTVTVKNANECTSTQAVNITQPLVLNVSVVGFTNASCFGGSDGTASVEATGGTTPYNYDWPGSPVGDGTENVTGLSAGSYVVTVTDFNNCSTNTTVTIGQPTQLTATISAQSNVSCFGGANGAATVTAGGGTPGYTYNWEGSPTGDGSVSISNLAAGTYTVTVSDLNSCTTTTAAVITQPTQVTATISAQTNVSCFGGANGAATVTPGGGTPGYTYEWEGSPAGDGTMTITGLVAGTYTVTVTDNNSCATTTAAVITQPSALTASITAQTNVSCNGGANGSATVTPNGGTAPYSYDWSGTPAGDGTETVSGLAAGTYTVTVTDDNLCQTITSVVITEPTLLTATISAQMNVTCNGGNNGAATVTANGGTMPYMYDWHASPNGDGTASITDLIAVTFTVTVTDNLGCQATAEAVITQPAALSATTSAQTNVSCNGGNNGAATVSVNGGVSPYNYDWEGTPSGEGTPGISNLTAGVYNLTVTDNNSCPLLYSVVITEPAVLTATIGAQTNVSCNAGANGAATVNVAGGTTPYSYDWTGTPTGDGSASVSDLTAGTYTVTVTDANLCVSVTSVTITEPTVLTASINTQVNATCNGLSDGSATATVSGGTATYSFDWPGMPTGDGTPTASDLAAGTYVLTVTDANSCVTTTSVTITQPDVLVLTATPNQPCTGFLGSVTLSATGGTLAYTYSGDPTTNLAAGTYNYTVTDANSCEDTESATITPNPLPTVAAITGINYTYIGSTTQLNNATPGGVWSSANTGVATVDGAGLVAGVSTGTSIISYTVTDINGCVNTSTATVYVNVPILDVGLFDYQNPTPAGNKLKVKYRPVIDIPNVVNNYTDGQFSIRCLTSLGVTFNIPPATNPFGYQQFGAVVDGPYTYYRFSFTLNAPKTITGLAGQEYDLVLLEYDCIGDATFEIADDAFAVSINGEYYQELTINSVAGDQANIIYQPSATSASLPAISASATPTTLCVGASLDLNSSTSNGVGPFSYLWAGPDGFSDATADPVAFTVSALSAGTYTVVVTDAVNGCTASDDVLVNVPVPAVTATGGSFNRTQTVVLSATAPTAVSYAWEGPLGYTGNGNPATPPPPSTNTLYSGTYTVTVTDVNTCTNTATASVVIFPAVLYVNDNSTSGDTYTSAVGDDNNPGTQALPLRTIQKAIDVALAGDEINVDAGTYAENVVVGKSVSILGPNQGVNPCSGARAAEAILTTAVSDIAGNGAYAVVDVQASDVTLDGLTIDGDNTGINTGKTSTTSADIDIALGITRYVTGDNMRVINNIIKNTSYFGVELYDYPAGVASSGNEVSNNNIQDLGTYDASSGIDYWGGGVLLYNNQYTAVSNNCMTNVRVGVQTGNYYQANPGAASYQEISGNTMTVRRRGIFHNLHYSAASPMTLSGNTITAIADPNETVWDGILFGSLTVPSTAMNNTINGAATSNASEGYEVWNVGAATPAQIIGGSVSGVDIGLLVDNYEGYNSDANSGAHASVSGLSINADNIGIRLHDNPLSSHKNVQLAIGAGVTINGGIDGLVLENANTAIIGATLSNLSISGNSGNYIELIANAGDLDATAVSFNGNTGATASNAQNFAIEDKIEHQIDLKTLGFVQVKANQAFITDAAPASADNNDYTRIRNAVEAASNNWTLNFEGSFDWTEANAAAAWALGNDGIVSATDDYSILVPANLNGVTFTAPEGLGTASITGPGDLATANLEGVLVFDGGDNQNWTISNMEFLNFDMGLGFFNGAGGTDAFNGTTITGNRFDIATDLNTVVAPTDVNQNIGLHYSFGTNQTITNNVFNISGDGISNGTNYSTSVGMQSNTSGGSVYDGLLISGNTINILNAQSANPQVVLGIWENGHAHTSDITVSNNQFLNLGAGNDPATNLQRAFRVTSHSGGATGVTYSGNTVEGANIGFQWIAGSNFSAQQAISVSGNTLSGNSIALLVQSEGKANLSNNNFNGTTDNTTDLQIVSGVVSSGGNNQFAGDTWYVDNQSPNAINISADVFDQSNLYRRADRINDALDNSARGLVRFDNSNLYVSTPGTSSTDETIPNAVAAAAASGDIVHIETGTYTSDADASTKELGFAPGSSPGCVTLNGNMLLTSGDALEIEIDGLTPCSAHDQFTVNGSVTLGGADLNLSVGYTSSIGDAFTIISNDGADAVVGQFAQGLSIAVGGDVFAIDYSGGDGNDVVLTRCSGGVTNTNTGKVFCSIQDAIDDVTTLNSHVLTVAAGTYAENVIVNKSVTILGPNAAVNPCSGSRAAEAIVHPAVAAISTGEIFHVAASNVTISGLLIDGDNPALTSGFTSTNGADIDAAEGITVYETGVNNLTVSNNILRNLSYFGVTLYDYPAGVPSSGHSISNNRFEDFGTYDAGSGISLWGGGVLLYNNQYTAITDNCMNNLRVGVQTGNFYQANPGAAAYQLISGNTMTVRRRGVFHNLHYSTASPFTLSNNTITALADANESLWDGILLSSLTVPATAQNNTINGAATANPSEGYEVWNVGAATPAQISGGSVSGVDIGLSVNNFEGYSTDAPDGAHANVSGLSINADNIGIRLHDNPSSTHKNVQLTIGSGVSINGGSDGLVLENANASIVGGALSDLAFVAQSSNYIELIVNTGYLNATSATFDGTTGAAKSLTQNFATEDKILHATDNAALGFVRVKATEVFVTTNSGSIQRGISPAATGDIVNVADGFYNEDVDINKDITVDGQSTAAVIRGLYTGGNTVIVSASGATLKDVKVTRDYGADLSAWYASNKNQGVTIGNGTSGVTLDNLLVTDNRNGIYINNAQNFLVQNCTVEDNRTGIQLVNNVSGGQILNNFIRDNFTLGVLYNVFGGTNFVGAGFSLNDNDISGNWYAQISFHNTGGTIGDLTGFDNNCNWLGNTNPNFAAVASGEPGYAAQVPSQFGGSDPGLNQDIRGTAANSITYLPFLTLGDDDQPGTDGFQAVPGNCNGTGPVLNFTQNITYPSIQLAINAANGGDRIDVSAGTYIEQVTVNKSLDLRGANYGIAGCLGRSAESTVSATTGTGFTVSADNVSIDGFEITGSIGISTAGSEGTALKNNKITTELLGIQASNINTTASLGFAIEDNCLTQTTRVVGGTQATSGIYLNGVSGTQAIVVDDNDVMDGYYGYVLYGVNTTPATTVSGGLISGVMQGVAVVNTVGGPLLPTNAIVEDISMSGFATASPVLPASHFNAGVYTFTAAPTTPANGITLSVSNVTVDGTQAINAPSGAIYVADFSTGGLTVQNITVQACNFLNNANRGVDAGGYAEVTVNQSILTNNGNAAWGTGGNDGFAFIAQRGATLNVSNCFINHPATSTTPVTAFLVGNAPASTINASNNSILTNGNAQAFGTGTSSGFINASCNWWGTANIDVFELLLNGAVFFTPYLNSGTDNEIATPGFQPAPGTCVTPTDFYVNDNSQVGDLLTTAVGSDVLPGTRGTKNRPFLTIAAAINAAVNGDDVFVDIGNYYAQTIVNKDVTIQGAGTSTYPVINFAGTVSGKPTLFDVTADGVTIDHLQFEVDLSKLNSAIIASAANLDNITVQNSVINPYKSVVNTYFGSYGNRNAISINYGGPTNYRVATGGVNNIVIDNNRVTATVIGAFLGDGNDDTGFRSAVSVDEGAGMYTNNIFQTINHDVLVRFNSNGPIQISNNTFNGGGVTVAEHNAGGGAVTIEDNTFDGSVTASVLRLQNNQELKATTVNNNVFNNLRWGISLENYPGATISGNTFNPIAGSTDFRHITVNTKSLSTNSSSIVQTEIDGVFTGNTFNSGATPGGTAMAFYNHDSDNADLGNFTVGTAGSPNAFGPNFTHALYFGDQTGLTLSATTAFPEYNLGAGSNTTMACWTRDIDIRNNTFDVGAGQQLPPAMNSVQRAALEGKLYHLPDNSCLGEMIFFLPVEVVAKVFLQGPYNPATNTMADNLRLITTAPLFPVSEPYSQYNTAEYNFAFVPVNNTATEVTTPLVLSNNDINNAIVDWIWLELRDKNDHTIVRATRAALLQRDGDIVDVDGVSNVVFPDAYIDQYYLMVKHRNHLGAMTLNPIDYSGGPVSTDFSLASTLTFGTSTTSARKELEPGVWGLLAGNTNLKANGSSFQVRYNGSNNDRVPILNIVGATTPLNVVNGYLIEDVNLNGQVKYSGSNNDRIIILNNINPSTPLNTITQQPQQ